MLFVLKQMGLCHAGLRHFDSMLLFLVSHVKRMLFRWHFIVSEYRVFLEIIRLLALAVNNEYNSAHMPHWLLIV